MRQPSEESLQIAVSRYLRLQYPTLIFTAESSGIRLTIGQAVKAKKMRSESGLPDLIILEPRGPYHGLVLELKKEGTTIFLKDGSLTKNKHIREQHAVMKKLFHKGYMALFACGYEHAKIIIDKYMEGRLGIDTFFRM